jgi:hypothetical protein
MTAAPGTNAPTTAKELPMTDASMALATQSDARLPATYEAAQRALAECSRVDECKDWADKAQALASYAKQAKDATLHNMALRIQSRAMRRAGELLKQIQPASGTRTDLQPQDGADPRLTRESAGNEAGFSERQRKTALRVANISERTFTAAVESPNPPTVTALAALGTVQRREPLAPLPGHALRGAAAAQTLLRDLAAFCGTHEAVAVATAVQDPEIMRGFVTSIDRWLDQFVTHLRSGEEGAA